MSYRLWAHAGYHALNVRPSGSVRIALEYQIAGSGYFAIARRNDWHWGHSIRIEVFNSDRDYLGQLQFACHPEFDDFDACQQMTTDELLAAIAKRLEVGMAQSAFAEAWGDGIAPMFHLN